MKIVNVTKSIHGQTILKDVTLTIEPGKITGIIGRNGAGKTTLLRLLVGILKPMTGDVTVEGKSIFRSPEIKEEVVFVPASADALKTYTLKEVQRLYQATYPKFDDKLFNELVNKFGLPRAGKIGSYSKGMTALFALILALSTRAKYILLDEPTDGLDVIIKKQMLQFLIEAVADYEVAIVISSHRLDELEFMADTIVMLQEGEIQQSYSLDTLKASYKKVQVVFPQGFPAFLKSDFTLLQETGKVAIVLLDGDLDKKLAQLKSLNPLFFEELPITLEDLFVAKLGGEVYAD
ncbi:ABC transporter ATP-binding protein [Halalkalibacterium ligniniphilum]|uniref:ABC transporter ATP-binding protein n=1 Tax=Halalkalibacterium ligniniphilum TaxID=1134413 RepID=UPI0003492C05|nr:ABC transporter ATP-binding protein [Halalkalibacterium ligniniphilum]